MADLFTLKCVACRVDAPLVSAAGRLAAAGSGMGCYQARGYPPSGARFELPGFRGGACVHQRSGCVGGKRESLLGHPDRMGSCHYRPVDAQNRGLHRNDFVAAAKIDRLL